MTMKDLLRWDGRCSIEEYENGVKEHNRFMRNLKKWSFKAYDEKDSMSVFAEDEHDDPRYIKHLEEFQKAMVKVDEYQTKAKAKAKELWG